MLVRDMPLTRRVIHWGIWRLKDLDKWVMFRYADCKKCGDSGALTLGGGPFMADCPCKAKHADWDY